MALSDLVVKRKKPKEKPYKLTDERGLYLLVHPKNFKYWRFKYYFAGKEKLLALGVYPEVSLGEARNRRDEARKQLANGIDPGVVKQNSKRTAKVAALNTFEIIAREWHCKQSSQWVLKNSKQIIRRLERDVFPWIGSRPIAEITPTDLLTVMRRIESRGVIETAHRIYQYCGQIFRYAVATARLERSPAIDLRGALSRVKINHYPAITDPIKIGELMRAIKGYQGSLVVGCALRLAPLIFVRPGELRQAEWSEINLNTAEWNIPAKKMKMRQSHLVPLSHQAISILQELYPVTGGEKYVFPSIRIQTRPMSDNTLNSALRRLGYTTEEVTAHGFRATARTLLDEVLGFRPDVIEHQLAHAVKDPNGRAYNRTSHLQIRREMMQRWSDYLDELAKG